MCKTIHADKNRYFMIICQKDRDEQVTILNDDAAPKPKEGNEHDPQYARNGRCHAPSFVGSTGPTGHNP